MSFSCFASYTGDSQVVLVTQLDKALPKQKLFCRALQSIKFELTKLDFEISSTENKMPTMGFIELSIESLLFEESVVSFLCHIWLTFFLTSILLNSIFFELNFADFLTELLLN